MGPWRLNCAYDRPIPRRIAEATGLKRGMFGQVKIASVLEFPPPLLPVGDKLRREYIRFLVRNGLVKWWQTFLLDWIRKWNSVVITTSPKRHRWNYYMQRLVSKLTRRRFEWVPLRADLNGTIFCFCANCVVSDYVAALAKDKTSQDLSNASPSVARPPVPAMSTPPTTT